MNKIWISLLDKRRLGSKGVVVFIQKNIARFIIKNCPVYKKPLISEQINYFINTFLSFSKTAYLQKTFGFLTIIYLIIGALLNGRSMPNLS